MKSRLTDSPLHIAEVGCGSGIRTLWLLKKHPNYSATLIDYSHQALALSRGIYEIGGGIGNATFVPADALGLPFPNNTFDIVWNSGVNEHFIGEQRQMVFNEMARVCKGTVLVMVPNSLNIPYRVHKWWAEKHVLYKFGPEAPFSVFELRRRLIQAGLKPYKIAGSATLSSLMLLRHMVPVRIVLKIPVARTVETNGSSSYQSIICLRRVSIAVDGLLSFIGGLTGLTIGIAASKE